MATAEEILLAAGEEKNVQPDVLIIDNDLRTITIPESVKILGVEGDDDVKRLHFTMPRTYGEFDLGVFVVHIVYANANNEPDMYLVTDAERGVDEITFSWLVGENALKYKGETQFAVHLRRVADGKVVQRFNTEPAKIRVLNGLDTDISPEEAEKARDIITQLINMLSEQVDEKIKEAQEAGAAQVKAVNVAGAVQVAAVEAKGEATLASIPADYTKLGNDVSQLKDTKADAILDTSARAASHTLHAQRGRISATLFGKTTETGSGDKSPDNPYTISGVETATINVGGVEHILPLLPDGAPLMGNGTVDGIVENDVRSGCDKNIVLNGTQTLYSYSVSTWGQYVCAYTRDAADILKATKPYCDRISSGIDPFDNREYVASNSGENGYLYIKLSADRIGLESITTAEAGLAALNAYLSANPLKVYYRSTDYTQDKELRVCRVERKKKRIELTGNETFSIQSVNANNIVNVLFEARLNKWPYIASGLNSSHFANQTSGIANTTGDGIYLADNNNFYIRIKASRLSSATLDGVKAYIKSFADIGKPITLEYNVATSEVYMTDRVEARKPDTLTTDTVTVTGSGETAVEYPHDAKHYTDQQHDSLARAVEKNAEAIDALSKDKADKEKPYELIETITLEEDSTITRDIEPNGKLYKFTAVSIKGLETTPSAQGNQTNYLCNNTVVGYAWWSGKTGNGTYKRIDEIKIDKGFWRSEWVDWRTGNDAAMSRYISTYALGHDAKTYPYITKIVISQMLTAGTTIEIWGVRA